MRAIATLLAMLAATVSPSGHAADDTELTARYAAALSRAIEAQWTRPDAIPDGQACSLAITQIPGGVVVAASVEPGCPYGETGKRSIQDAVLKAQPLPYAGFESVFRRNLLLRFVPSSDSRGAQVPPPSQAAPVETRASAKQLPPECSGLISVTYQPARDALIAMLGQRSDVPAGTVFRLGLFFAMDADGIPVHVSIAESSHDRDIDKAALAWGRDVKFSTAPGCAVSRVGVLRMVLVP